MIYFTSYFMQTLTSLDVAYNRIGKYAVKKLENLFNGSRKGEINCGGQNE